MIDKDTGKRAYKKANQMEDGDANITLRDFPIDELKCFLLTLDGMGQEFKVRVLDELMERVGKERL